MLARLEIRHAQEHGNGLVKKTQGTLPALCLEIDRIVIFEVFVELSVCRAAAHALGVIRNRGHLEVIQPNKLPNKLPGIQPINCQAYNKLWAKIFGIHVLGAITPNRYK